MTAPYRQFSWSTRSALFGLALAFASPAAAQSLVISNWDGYMAPDAMDAFKAATGVSGDDEAPELVHVRGHLTGAGR